MRKALIKAVLIILCVMMVGGLLACGESEPSPSVTPQVSVTGISISTPLSRIIWGTPYEDVRSTFSYVVSYSNGTTRTYTSSDTSFTSACTLSCTPSYDPAASGVSYVFQASFAGFTSNSVCLSVPVEEVGLELSIPSTEIGVGISESTLKNLLSVKKVFSDGTKEDFIGDFSMILSSASDLAVSGSQVTVKVSADGFTSNELTLTVSDSLISSIEIRSSLTEIPFGFSEMDVINSFSLYANYSNGFSVKIMDDVVYSCAPAFNSENAGETLTFSVSFGGFTDEIALVVSGTPLNEIRLENTGVVKITTGSSEQSLLALLGRVTFVYGSTEYDVKHPNLVYTKVSGTSNEYSETSAVGDRFNFKIVSGGISSATVSLEVLPDFEIVYHPNEIAVGATLDEVKNFILVKYLDASGNIISNYAGEKFSFSAEYFDSALGNRSDFVLSLGSKTVRFSANSANISLILDSPDREGVTSVIPANSTLEDLATKFNLFMVDSSGAKHAMPVFTLTSDYSPTSLASMFTFKVTFGSVSSNERALTTADGFSFKGEGNADYHYFDFGTATSDIINALDIHATKGNERVLTLKANNPLLKTTAFYGYDGRDGKAFSYEVEIDFAGIIKAVTINIRGENTAKLGKEIAVSSSDGIVVTDVSGSLGTVRPEKSTRYYYTISDVPMAVYNTNPLSFIKYNFLHAREASDRYAKYIGKYVGFLSGLLSSTSVPNQPEIVGDVTFGATFYHSLCTAKSSGSTVFTARVKLTVKSINTVESLTVSTLREKIFDNDSMISFYKNIGFQDFKTAFVYSSVTGNVSVGDEIWIDITGSQFNLL